jgi:hypothetical protein
MPSKHNSHRARSGRSTDNSNSTTFAAHAASNDEAPDVDSTTEFPPMGTSPPPTKSNLPHAGKSGRPNIPVPIDYTRRWYPTENFASDHRMIKNATDVGIPSHQIKPIRQPRPGDYIVHARDQHLASRPRDNQKPDPPPRGYRTKLQSSDLAKHGVYTPSYPRQNVRVIAEPRPEEDCKMPQSYLNDWLAGSSNSHKLATAEWETINPRQRNQNELLLRINQLEDELEAARHVARQERFIRLKTEEHHEHDTIQYKSMQRQLQEQQVVQAQLETALATKDAQIQVFHSLVEGLHKNKLHDRSSLQRVRDSFIESSKRLRNLAIKHANDDSTGALVELAQGADDMLCELRDYLDIHKELPSAAAMADIPALVQSHWAQLEGSISQKQQELFLGMSFSIGDALVARRERRAGMIAGRFLQRGKQIDLATTRTAADNIIDDINEQCTAAGAQVTEEAYQLGWLVGYHQGVKSDPDGDEWSSRLYDLGVVMTSLFTDDEIDTTPDFCAISNALNSTTPNPVEAAIQAGYDVDVQLQHEPARFVPGVRFKPFNTDTALLDDVEAINDILKNREDRRRVKQATPITVQQTSVSLGPVPGSAPAPEPAPALESTPAHSPPTRFRHSFVEPGNNDIDTYVSDGFIPNSPALSMRSCTWFRHNDDDGFIPNSPALSVRSYAGFRHNDDDLSVDDDYIIRYRYNDYEWDRGRDAGGSVGDVGP